MSRSPWRALVTGSSGLLGSAIAGLLARHIDKAVRQLGYRPRRNFRELLNELVAGERPNAGIDPCLRPCA